MNVNVLEGCRKLKIGGNEARDTGDLTY